MLAFSFRRADNVEMKTISPFYLWNGVVLLLAISTPIAAQAQQVNDPSPVVLPGHRYDLPATLITAAQIESHKKSMIGARLTDIPMNMVKSGAETTIINLVSASLTVTRARRTQTMPFTMTWRRFTTFSKAGAT
ncbi:MAG: hypothetical protein C5B51_00410 [Terriglobia bacterium]|nr:MAG: hypothetical protein C5B51_00410 [Terriglobia bacterium]